MAKREKFIPSMFHRRLVLLAVVCAVWIIVLSGQMFRLSVLEGSERLASAEAKLENRVILPTNRGRILDRYQRVLALDRASSDVAVEYDVIVGTWPRAKAAEQARHEVGRTTWGSMSREQRDAGIREHLPEWTKKCDDLFAALCKLGGISIEELQRRFDAIKAEVQTTAAEVWERQRLDERSRFGIADGEEYDFKARPIAEQRLAHVVLPHIADEIAFKRLSSQFPDMIEVQNSRKREYPWLGAEVPLSRASLPKPIRDEKTPTTIRVVGVADHILGAMRDEVWDEDVKRRPFKNSKTGEIDLGWYRQGDSVGARGLEKVFEDSLRGLRGEIRERRDTNEQARINAQPGKDLQLTLDIALQARVQAILSPEFGLTRVQPWHMNTSLPLGTTLNAAAVVIEVETGDILAMVSMPSLAMSDLMTEQQRQNDQPIVNRPVEAMYPPGSIIKPLVLCAAVSEGLHNLDQTITCTGHYFADKPAVARCWIYRERYGMATHGPLKADEALARSCNIFFFTLGDRLGIDRMVKWFHRFGLGEALDIGLLTSSLDGTGKPVQIGEANGSLPSKQDIAKLRVEGQLKFSEVIMGIGQGPIAWTPVQAANAYATIARGGVIRDATLLMNDPRGSRPQRTDDLHLSPKLVATTLEGLRQAAMEHHGTGNHIAYEGFGEEPIINAEGVQVWAKTGTAQANKSRGLDHSWFVGLAGPKDGNRPLLAITVIVENGGSGGRAAGPIANQIIHALQAEGYLPGDPNAYVSSKGTITTTPAPEPSTEREDDH